MQAELVERASKGDKDAFASLVSSSIDGCYALAYRIVRDPHRAQDATQQALLGAWRDLRPSATPIALTPGCTASWSTPATRKPAVNAAT
jgi:DNA-directed RNA polymerase specialized sigma24 family protein